MDGSQWQAVLAAEPAGLRPPDLEAMMTHVVGRVSKAMEAVRILTVTRSVDAWRNMRPSYRFHAQLETDA